MAGLVVSRDGIVPAGRGVTGDKVRVTASHQADGDGIGYGAHGGRTGETTGRPARAASVADATRGNRPRVRVAGGGGTGWPGRADDVLAAAGATSGGRRASGDRRTAGPHRRVAGWPQAPGPGYRRSVTAPLLCVKAAVAWRRRRS